MLAELNGVGVKYAISRVGRSSAKDVALRWWSARREALALWALRDVSLAIKAGDALAIVGRNGAGKSSLLRVLSGRIRPQVGSVKITSSVTRVLDIGAGLDPELTGRENAYLLALLQGREPAEIQDRLESIVEFSGLGEAIDRQARGYSTGMHARLCFSVASAFPADMLLVDEGLAVGDLAFQQKCRERLSGMRKSAQAVVLTSHDPQQLRDFCTRALWLDGGRIVGEGPVGEILDRYAQPHGGV